MAGRVIHAVVLLLPLLLLLGGCRSESVKYEPEHSCTALHDRMAECRPKFGIERDAFVRRCEQYQTDYAPLLKCGGKRPCDRFNGCMKLGRDQMEGPRRVRRLRGLKERLESLTARREWAQLERECETLLVDLDPGDLRQMCADVSRRAVRALTTTLEGLRDDPTKAGHLNQCDLLLGYASRMAAADVRAAQRLCREVRLVAEAHGVTAEAVRRAEAGDGRVPAACDPTLRRLLEVDTRPMRQAWSRVAKACFVTLGQVVLDGVQTGCPPEARRVLAALEKHRLKQGTIGKRAAALLEDACR